jgi:HAD superfamily hydrolase (TIGR01509 family)
MTPKVIIFDIGEVLLKGFLGIEELLGKKSNLSAKRINQALRGAHLDELFRGKISEDIYIEKVLQNKNLTFSKDELKRVIRENFSEIPGTRQIIETLKKKYKVVALSVHAREWIEYCKQHIDLDALFADGAFISFATGSMKPEEKAFREVLETMRAHPNETLFIDDSETNIAAARTLGIRAIQFESATQLKRELQELNIL